MVLDQMTSMLNDPRVLEQMAGAMSNPAVIDQVIAMNPQLGAMAPQVRQVFQSEEFRRIMYISFPYHIFPELTLP